MGVLVSTNVNFLSRFNALRIETASFLVSSSDFIFQK